MELGFLFHIPQIIEGSARVAGLTVEETFVQQAREAEHRAVGRLTERARRYTPNTTARARRRPARLPPSNVLDYWWGVPPRY